MKRINAISFIFLGLLTAGTISYAQTTYNFTKSGASGYQGPTQSQVNSTYNGTTLNNAVTINTRGVQEWTVPATGVYTIEAWGAAGTNGSSQPAGYGARMKGDFSLTQGTVLKIIVGQMPELTSYGSAGGGGTFVVKSSSNYADSDVLVIAGGGGGITGNSTNVTNAHASAGTTGGTSQTGATGGSNGQGAPAAGYSGSKSCAGQGAGYLSDGGATDCGTITGNDVAQSFVDGGQGGKGSCGRNPYGGFGGGGGVGCSGAGGGGGYSGGGGSYSSGYGGGGASKNNGTNQSNEGGVWNSDGKVVIEACIGFCFESMAVANDNSYADITFSAGAYSANNGSGALTTSDLALTFNRNGGVATNATISSIKKNNNTSEGSAGALAGGETVIRMFLNLTGVPVGLESITVAPANSSSIYNSSGTAMATTSNVGANLKDQNGPYITGALVNSANSQVSVTFSETAYSTNGGSGALTAADFSLAISGGAATLNSATPTSISQSSNTYTLGFSVSVPRMD